MFWGQFGATFRSVPIVLQAYKGSLPLGWRHGKDLQLNGKAQIGPAWSCKRQSPAERVSGFCEKTFVGRFMGGRWRDTLGPMSAMASLRRNLRGPRWMTSGLLQYQAGPDRVPSSGAQHLVGMLKVPKDCPWQQYFKGSGFC